MGVQADPGRSRSSTQSRPPLFRRLLPPGAPAGVEQILEDLHLGDRADARAERPYVLLNMVSTVDGRATVDGRSGTLGNRADRELFRGLRGAVDAVMAGAGTVRVERYGRIIPEASRRDLRRERGLTAEPLACIVSGRLALAPDIPLLAEPSSHVVIVTSATASLPQSGARIDYVRSRRDGRIDLTVALGELHDRFGVRTLLCEGGPHLNSELLAAGLVDELFLTISATLAGGDQMSGGSLRIFAGAEFAELVELELLSALEWESNLFLRYGVRASAAERVS